MFGFNLVGKLTNPVRVLIVDDSAAMRQLITFRLRSDKRIIVVGEAASADEARRAISMLSPDVLTLDVEMPGMSGLDFLGKLMQTAPMPVIMVSRETQKGSAAAIEALARGAVDCIGKSDCQESRSAFAELPALIVGAAKANVRGKKNKIQPSRTAAIDFEWNRKIILIGSSTGGVAALEQIFAELPENCPPILITQHMPKDLLESFAQRMNSRHAPVIKLAEHNAELEPGTISIAPGGEVHLAVGPGLRPRSLLLESGKVSGHRPSVDVLFESATPIADRIVAAILTGMGFDGAKGMLGLRQHGAFCLAQDEASSIVWGMPRVAWEMGGANRLVPLETMAPELLAATGWRKHS